MGLCSSLNTVGVIAASWSIGLGLCAGCLPKLAMMALANSVVFKAGVFLSPKSPVCWPDSRVYSSAFSIIAADCINPRWRNIPNPLNNRAVGLAIFLPAISGAVPWTASKIEIWAPILAEGANPNPPTQPAQRSLTISPCKLVNTTTSNRSGRLTSFIHKSSTITSSAFSSGYSFAIS